MQQARRGAFKIAGAKPRRPGKPREQKTSGDPDMHDIPPASGKPGIPLASGAPDVAAPARESNPPPKNARKHVTIYTDGSCLSNPDGPGGWSAILTFGAAEKVASGGEASTTNNRMEMTAAIKALELLKEPCLVTLRSDSAYLVNAFNKGWLKSWRKKGWKLADGGDVKNVDLWRVLEELCETHIVTFEKVRGHSTDQYNNRCDKLAVAEAEKLKN